MKAQLTASASDALASFSHLPGDAFVRLPVVCGLFGVGPATVWRWSKSANFPQPRKISSRTTGWKVSELREHLRGL